LVPERAERYDRKRIIFGIQVSEQQLVVTLRGYLGRTYVGKLFINLQKIFCRFFLDA